MVEVQTSPHGLRHLLRGHGGVVQLLELRNVPDDGPPVQVGVALGTRVLLQPQVLQSRKISQVANLADVRNTVFANVQFL